MGLILLVGLIVKNGIILLDFTKRRMEHDGVDLETGICDAARVRLRPILMTTLCTLFGLLPLALGIGARGVSCRSRSATRRDRRARPLDADHAVRGAGAARGDPGTRVPVAEAGVGETIGVE